MKVVLRNFQDFKTIEVEPNEIVADLKKKIEGVFGENVCPAERQLLFLQNKSKIVLEDNNTMHLSQVTEGSHIFIYLRELAVGSPEKRKEAKTQTEDEPLDKRVGQAKSFGHPPLQLKLSSEDNMVIPYISQTPASHRKMPAAVIFGTDVALGLSSDHLAGTKFLTLPSLKTFMAATSRRIGETLDKSRIIQTSKPGTTIKVLVRTFQAINLPVKVKPEDTVDDLKKKIENEYGAHNFPAAQQLLLHEGKYLVHKTLGENNITENSSFDLFLRELADGSPQAKTQAQIAELPNTDLVDKTLPEAIMLVEPAGHPPAQGKLSSKESNVLLSSPQITPRHRTVLASLTEGRETAPRPASYQFGITVDTMANFFSTEPSSPSYSESDPEFNDEALLCERLGVRKGIDMLKTVAGRFTTSHAIFNNLEQMEALKGSLEFFCSYGAAVGIPYNWQVTIIEVKARLAVSERKYKKFEEVHSKINSLMVVEKKAIDEIADFRCQFEELKRTRDEGRAEISELDKNVAIDEELQKMIDCYWSATKPVATVKSCRKELKLLKGQAKEAEGEKISAFNDLESIMRFLKRLIFDWQ